jgi:hypothetical protein
MAASTSKGGACMIINNEKDVTTAVLSELARVAAAGRGRCRPC